MFSRTAAVVQTILLTLLALGDGAAAEPGSAGREIAATALKIGAIYALSGEDAETGQDELDAARLAVEDLNRRGGIAEKQVVLISDDSRSTVAGGAQALEELAARGISVILGPSGPLAAAKLARLAERRGVLLISASGIGSSAASARTYAFGLRPPAESAVRPLVALIASRPYREIAVVYAKSPYYSELFEEISRGLEKADKALGSVIRVDPKLRDYHRVVKTLGRTSPDALVVLLPEEGENAGLLSQLRRANRNLAVFGSSSLMRDPGVRRNIKLAEGVYYFDYIPRAPGRFIRRFKERYGGFPSFSAPLAYDSVQLLKSAIETCSEETLQLMSCLQNRNFSGLSGSISFDENGSRIAAPRSTALFRIENGRPVFVKTPKLELY